MALRKTLTQRLFSISRTTNTTCRISLPCSAAKSALLNRRDSPSNNSDHDVFRRYIHRSTSSSSPPEFRLFPTGEKLLEKIQEMGFVKNKDRFEGMVANNYKATEEMTVMDARKILKVSRLESVKERLRGVEKECVTYSEFLEICGQDCASFDQGMEFARMLDESGCVIVIGNNVFLRPDKVVKDIQGLIQTPSLPNPNDPMLKELQELETQKTAIDKKADLLVRRELWCGLGYLIVQTSAFMRLTFWELTWDVMEPICFYVTSMYFMGGYAFFLRTAKEPSFEGFFQSRLEAKQKRLIKAHKFDLERYNEVKKACYPHSSVSRGTSVSFGSTDHDVALRRQ